MTHRHGGVSSTVRATSRPAPGSIGLVATAACLATLVLLLVPPPANGAGADDATVSGLAPKPGAIVQVGVVQLQARLHSAHPITAARFLVGDGHAIAATVGAHDPIRGTPVQASVHLDPGEHTVRVAGEDTQAQRFERAWWVTATERAIHRFAGASRIDTAVATSMAAFPADASTHAAVLARADDFADALAGVPLAAAVEGPLLLSGSGALPPATARELQRVLVPGSVVHLLGGEGALADVVERAVAALGMRVQRHGGRDRYATAAAIARELPTSSGAVIASGVSFPDALASSAPAAREGWPILLTPRSHLAGATAAALAERGVADATIVGGPAAVGAEVERQARQVVETVTRVAGTDRYATAAAVVETFYTSTSGSGMSLASGMDFPDALSGTRHAALLDQPLLLTRPSGLPAATADAVRTRRPRRLDVYGGPAAVADHTVEQALRAAIDGPHAPRITATAPAAGATVGTLDTITVHLDRPVDPAASSISVEVGGAELPGVLDTAAAADTLTFRPHGPVVAARDTPWPARVVVRAVAVDGTVGHHTAPFTYFEPEPFFATAGAVALYLPSRGVDMIGFHESRHPGAQQQVEQPIATPRTTLPSRERSTGSHTAADVVAAPDLPVLAPVTGRVLRAGSYVLYCHHQDDYAVIEPDARPGWEVKILHFRGVRVRAGDRVIAYETVIGDGPRVLPFASQVDEHSSTGWPHLHIEVVDPSIPPRPGGGC